MNPEELFAQQQQGGDPPQNPKLRAHLEQRIRQRLAELKANVDESYVQKAVDHYSQPGSRLRQEFFKQEADLAAQEAQKAQLTGFGDGGMERMARDVGTGLVAGFTAPGRYVAHKMGIGDKDAEREAFAQMSGEGMGGRGLSSNPILGTIQSAIQPAAEMLGAAPMGNRAVGAVGGIIDRGARALPQSQVLRALQTVKPLAAGATRGQQAMNVARATPGAVVRGSAAGAVAMPEQTIEGGASGMAMGAGLSALDALAAARVPGAQGMSLGKAFKSVNEFFSPLDEAGAAPLAQRIDPSITQSPAQAAFGNQVPDMRGTQTIHGQTVPDPATSQIEATAASPTSLEVGSDVPAAGAKPRGGDPVDWDNLDPTQSTQASNFWASLDTPQKRAQALGVEKEMGMGGVSPTKWVVENLTNAKTPQELLGYLGRRLIEKSSGSKPKYMNAPSPRKGKIPAKAAEAAPVAEAAAPDIHADMWNAATPAQRAAKLGVTLDPATEGVLAGKTWDQLSPSDRAKFAHTGGAESVAAPAAAPTITPRPVKAKRQDVLANAARMEDGTLDWDKLDEPQRRALSKNLGKDYREKVMTMSLANIQKVLSEGQFMSFLKTLKMQPKAKVAGAAPDGTASPTPVVPEPEVPHVQAGAVSPRRKLAEAIVGKPVGPRKGVPLEELAAMTPEQIEAELAKSRGEPGETAPTAAVAPDGPVFEPGDYDAMDNAGRQSWLEAAGISGPRAKEMSALQFELLPRGLKQAVQSSQRPAAPVVPEGGAAPKAANFRARRKSGQQKGEARPQR